ncbi:hypothetical protein ACFQYP_60410 [Nonomuraea antimicrobica]
MTEMYDFTATHNGRRPIVKAYDSPEAELAGLRGTVDAWLADGVPPGEIAVGARNQRLVRDAKRVLDGLDVRASTFQHLKGHEFERVALIGVAEGVVPAPPPEDQPGDPPKIRPKIRTPGLVRCSANGAYCSSPAPVPDRCSISPIPEEGARFFPSDHIV